MKKLLSTVLLALLVLTSCGNLAKQAKHTFTIADGNFLYDGKPVQIHSGEMHFARIPAPYWRHRLKMMKAMGLNTVATYVFWNYHETAPGVWDFKSESRNIAEFIKIAGEEFDGYLASGSLCLCGMGIWRISLVVAKDSGAGHPYGQ